MICWTMLKNPSLDTLLGNTPNSFFLWFYTKGVDKKGPNQTRAQDIKNNRTENN